jgi:hypothetical protein
VECLANSRPWRWRWSVPPKWWISTKLHGITTQKTVYLLLFFLVQVSLPYKSVWTITISIYNNFNYISFLSMSPILRPTGQPVCLGIKHPSGACDQIFITVKLLQVCWCGALSLMRGWVCNLLLLLALVSAVIFGSESRGTRDHILLSQIRDFPFRRLLRLAGLRWRYSTLPPHGISLFIFSISMFCLTFHTFLDTDVLCCLYHEKGLKNWRHLLANLDGYSWVELVFH